MRQSRSEIALSDKLINSPVDLIGTRKRVFNFIHANIYNTFCQAARRYRTTAIEYSIRFQLGRRTVTTVPFSTSLSMSSVPPCAKAMRRQIAKPSPLPVSLLLRSRPSSTR